MLPLSIEIIITGVMFLVGVFSGVEMNRVGQRFALEWSTNGRPVVSLHKQKQNVIILVVSFLLGALVLPRLPAQISALVFLPFSAGMALAILVAVVQKFIHLR